MAAFVFATQSVKKSNARSRAATGTINLFQEDHSPDAATDVLADYTSKVATFSGYSAVTPGYSNADWDGGIHKSISAVATFQHNGGGVANTIYGYYITTGSTLIAAKKFDTPIVMDSFQDRIDIQLEAWGGEYASQPTGVEVNHDPRLISDAESIWAATTNGHICRVFSNDYTPVPGMDINNFTNASISPTQQAFSWVNSAEAAGEVTRDANTTFTFTNTTSGTVTVYGFYVTLANNTLIGALRFDTPVVMDTGDYVSFDLKALTRNYFTG